MRINSKMKLSALRYEQIHQQLQIWRFLLEKIKKNLENDPIIQRQTVIGDILYYSGVTKTLNKVKNRQTEQLTRL